MKTNQHGSDVLDIPDRAGADISLARALADVARAQRDRFAGGLRMRVGKSKVVHAVSPTPWMHETIPLPACHTPTFGWEPMRLHATGEQVTCTRCLRRAVHRTAGELPRAAPVQPPLFDAGGLRAA